MEYVLETSALCKRYRDFAALNGLDMHIPKGSIYGFVGRNGAGKTTLIRLICGLQEPQSERAARYLAVIRERTDAMRNLTEELFRYSVITATAEELRRETVCLNDVLEQSLAGFYGALSARGIAPDIQLRCGAGWSAPPQRASCTRGGTRSAAAAGPASPVTAPRWSAPGGFQCGGPTRHAVSPSAGSAAAVRTSVLHIKKEGSIRSDGAPVK